MTRYDDSGHSSHLTHRVRWRLRRQRDRVAGRRVYSVRGCATGTQRGRGLCKYGKKKAKNSYSRGERREEREKFQKKKFLALMFADSKSAFVCVSVYARFCWTGATHVTTCCLADDRLNTCARKDVVAATTTGAAHDNTLLSDGPRTLHRRASCSRAKRSTRMHINCGTHGKPARGQGRVRRSARVDEYNNYFVV